MQVFLLQITWPRQEDKDKDNDCSVETKCHVSSYTWQFIANGRFTCLRGLTNFILHFKWHNELFILMINNHSFESITPTELTSLVKFWTGWRASHPVARNQQQISHSFHLPGEHSHPRALQGPSLNVISSPVSALAKQELVLCEWHLGLCLHRSE